MGAFPAPVVVLINGAGHPSLGPFFYGPSQVLTEADFERCAALMMELHGDNAIARAQLRAAELRELGEQDAAEIWIQVKVTIERLQAISRRAPATAA
jgi:hypothetical protein